MASKRRSETGTEAAGLDWRAARRAFLTRLPPVEIDRQPDVELPVARPFPLCEPPQLRAGPQFVLYYRRLVGLPNIRRRPEPTGGDGKETIPAQLTCVPVVTGVDLAVSLLFEQDWFLQAVEIGDLASTLALAPAETLTIEVLTSQRRALEQRVVDSTEELRSVESQITDKEVLNVARSASRTNSWKIDGTGSFSLGGLFSLGLAASAGASETVTRAAQQSQQQVHEQTTKSTHSLRTLHRVEVRGVTESLVQERMTRVLSNPYRDRTMTVNVFELQKRFAVALSVTEVRPALRLALDVDFDAEFIAGNSQFLKDELLDQALVELVPLAVAAADPPADVRGQTDAARRAHRALDLLFEATGVFPLFRPEEIDEATIDTGDPGVTFDEPWRTLIDAPDTIDNAFIVQTTIQRSGWVVTRGNRKVFLLFLTLSVFYRAWQRLVRTSLDEEQALSFARTVSRSLRSLWSDILGSAVDQVTGDEGATNRLFELLRDEQPFTEVLRRVPGFLALTADLTEQPTDPAAGTVAGPGIEEFDEATDALSTVRHHLRCNARYYTRRWLGYLLDRTGNSAFAEMISDVLGRHADGSQLARVFDPATCYVDDDAVIVLGSPIPLDRLTTIVDPTDEETPLTLPPPVVSDEVVPADGVHLEVAAGACLLDGVPDPVPLVPIPVVTLPGAVVPSSMPPPP